jgi:hypothetical protein
LTIKVVLLSLTFCLPSIYLPSKPGVGDMFAVVHLQSFMYVWVRTYVCMYVCMCVCVYVRMYSCMYVRTYVCVYVCMYVCMQVCVYVRMYVRTMYASVCMYVCTYVWMYVRTYVCMYVLVYVAVYMPVIYLCNKSHMLRSKISSITTAERERKLSKHPLQLKQLLVTLRCHSHLGLFLLPAANHNSTHSQSICLRPAFNVLSVPTGF